MLAIREVHTSQCFSNIELFQAQLLKQGLAPKTVNDIFTVIRGVWANAFGGGILKANPLDRISNVGTDADLKHADPFSREEIEQIGKADPARMQDVDLEAGTVHVRRASVVGEFKVPKERSRLRTVELIDPALELMREILADASQAPCIEIKVIQRDNITALTSADIRLPVRCCCRAMYLWNGWLGSWGMRIRLW